MNKYLVITSIFLVLISGCEKTSLEINSKKNDLIGVWQNINVVAAGWSNAFQFLANGKFIFHTSQMDCESRNRSFSGAWKVEQGYLFLEASSEQIIVGGELVEAMGSCGTDKDIEGGVLEEHDISPAKVMKLKISEIQIDRGKNRFDENYEMKMVDIDGNKYWKFEDDPSKY